MWPFMYSKAAGVPLALTDFTWSRLVSKSMTSGVVLSRRSNVIRVVPMIGSASAFGTVSASS